MLCVLTHAPCANWMHKLFHVIDCKVFFFDMFSNFNIPVVTFVLAWTAKSAAEYRLGMENGFQTYMFIMTGRKKEWQEEWLLLGHVWILFWIMLFRQKKPHLICLGICFLHLRSEKQHFDFDLTRDPLPPAKQTVFCQFCADLDFAVYDKHTVSSLYMVLVLQWQLCKW